MYARRLLEASEDSGTECVQLFPVATAPRRKREKRTAVADNYAELVLPRTALARCSSCSLDFLPSADAYRVSRVFP